MLTRIRVGLQALRVLKDDNANPYYARLLHLSFDGDTYARLAERMRQTDEGRRILDEKLTIPGEDVDISALERLPPSTLGHEYARYYIDNGIEPFDFEFPLQDDADFLNKRYRETHDIHHLITGYGIDEVGEVELQAFYLGNLGFRHAGLIVLVSIPYRLGKVGVKGIRGYVRRLRAAYRRGKSSHQLLTVSFDELWDQPVSEIAARVCAPACSLA
ncbi:Coq4 family protein [Enhygromyxa salina]|uniref:Coq4 family protein n=1 Tax=Enhygromyxa salina TaxID=215803 RepID=UPI0015E7DF24|nr:Coq4 family protein [Enhygromyxa salina]